MLREWIDGGVRPLPLVLKGSKTDLLAIDISAHISELLSKYRLTPRNLEVAISNDAYRICYAETVKLENELLEKGIRVSIDGFDGDYLALENTSADEITLDLKKLKEKGSDEDILGIFEQAVQRGIKMTARGIDTAKQLSSVKKAGCEYGQGAHLYQQLTRRELEALMGYSEK